MRWPRCSPRSSARWCRSRGATRAPSPMRARAAGLAAHASSAGRSRAIACASAMRRRASCSTSRASTCIARGRRRRTRCSGCATIPPAPTRSTRGVRDDADPGLMPQLTFDPADDLAAPFVARGRAAARRDPARAGRQRPGRDGGGVHARRLRRVRRAHDAIIATGRRALADFQGFVACGGFSYGDVLGAGEGWAKSILFNAAAARRSSPRSSRARDTFALGVCNGCQMMSNLHEIIPGAAHWPQFVRNASEQFEARFVMLEVLRHAVAVLRRHGRQPHSGRVAHGEGYAEFRDAGAARRRAAAGRAALRRHAAGATETLPAQPERLAAAASPGSRPPTAASRS